MRDFWILCPISRVWSHQGEEKETDGQTERVGELGAGDGSMGDNVKMCFSFSFSSSVLLFRPDITTMADWRKTRKVTYLFTVLLCLRANLSKLTFIMS